MMHWLCCCVLLLAYTGIQIDGALVTQEMKLYKDLLATGVRDVNARPVFNASDSIEISLGLNFQQLVDVDENKGVLKTNVWRIGSWLDATLNWRPEDYGGIDEARVPYTQMWQPDIHIYNDAEFHDPGSAAHPLAIVYSSGFVVHAWGDTLHTTCEFDLRHFPFDSHECKLQLVSWTYTTRKIQLTALPLEVEHLKPHAEWDVDIADPERDELSFPPEFPIPYHRLTWTMKLTRKPAFYRCVLVSPCVFIAILTPFLFLLKHSFKFPMGAGMLVSLTVLLHSLGQHIPTAHENVPILAQYMAGLFGLISIALILCNLTANLQAKSTCGKPPAKALKTTLVDKLGVLVCVRPGDYVDLAQVNAMWSMQQGDSASTVGTATPDGHSQARIVSPPASDENRMQWTLIARVLDRVFFVIFFILIILFSAIALTV